MLNALTTSSNLC